MEETDNTHLYARWLSNELTPEEAEHLESTGEAAILRTIIATVDQYRLPDLAAQTYERVQQEIEQKQAPVIPFYRRKTVVALAATITLLIGLFWISRLSSTNPVVSQPTELAGTTGQLREVTLADNTGIVLYGGSHITYDKSTFPGERKLSLKGEAFFDVRKKGAFEVQVPNGRIRVLGTQFNVLATDSVTVVRCYQGKVEVTINGKVTLLTPGKGVQLVNHAETVYSTFDPTEQDPAATSRYVENTSLREICTSLALQYGITFEPGKVDLDRKFTGTIQQTDLDAALQLIFEPMQINFRLENKRVYLDNR